MTKLNLASCQASQRCERSNHSLKPQGDDKFEAIADKRNPAEYGLEQNSCHTRDPDETLPCEWERDLKRNALATSKENFQLTA